MISINHMNSFSTLEAANQCARLHSLWADYENPEKKKVWAYEYASDGRRKFLCYTVPEFFEIYTMFDPLRRQFHEVLEGRNASRLFFDIEV